MIALDTAVKAEMIKIVQKFISIRAELEKADREVKTLLEKSKALNEERLALVKEEEELFKLIRQAYGPGQLNLRNLEWVPEEDAAKLITQN